MKFSIAFLWYALTLIINSSSTLWKKSLLKSDTLVDLEYMESLDVFVGVYAQGFYKIWNNRMKASGLGSLNCTSTVKSIDVFYDQPCFIVGCSKEVRIFCYNTSKFSEVTSLEYGAAQDVQISVYLVSPILYINAISKQALSCKLWIIQKNQQFFSKCQKNSNVFSSEFKGINRANYSFFYSPFASNNVTYVRKLSSMDSTVINKYTEGLVDKIEVGQVIYYLLGQKLYIAKIESYENKTLWKNNIEPEYVALKAYGNSIYIIYKNYIIEYDTQTNQTYKHFTEAGSQNIFSYSDGFFSNSVAQNKFQWFSFQKIPNTQLIQSNKTSNSSNSSEPTFPLPSNESVEQNTTQTVQTEEFYQCGEGCKYCLSQNSCHSCQSGYQFNKQTAKCQQIVIYALVASVFSIPYSAFAFKIIFVDMLQEFWFFEYHETNYKFTSSIIQFIGSVNRKKFIPAYANWVAGPLYDRYTEKKQQIFLDKTGFTRKKFLNKEREPAIFSLNTSKMYIWAFIISLCVIGLQRLAGYLTKRWKTVSKKFEHTKAKGILFLVLIQAYIQFVTFMFFQQIRAPSFENFKDKANLIFTVMFGFCVFVFTWAGYGMIKYFYRKAPKSMEYIYPGLNKNTKNLYLKVVMTGSGRKFFLGYIQTLYLNFYLQMSLLLILNFLSFWIVCCGNTQKSLQRKRYIQKCIYILLLVFIVSSMLSRFELAFTSQTHCQIQLVIICLFLAICIIDFLYIVFKGIISMIKAAKKALQQKNSQTNEQKGQEQNQNECMEIKNSEKRSTKSVKSIKKISVNIFTISESIKDENEP